MRSDCPAILALLNFCRRLEPNGRRNVLPVSCWVSFREVPGRLLHQHSAYNDAAFVCGACPSVRQCGTDSACVCCICSQAEGSWSKERCCAVHGNDCRSSPYVCYDRTASSNYLYRLSPGEPEHYETIPQGGTEYQAVRPTWWQHFGNGVDLKIGDNGPPGTSSSCPQEGSTYCGWDNAACGGNHNWGHTDLEVWRPL